MEGNPSLRLQSIDVGAAYRSLRDRLSEMLAPLEGSVWDRMVPHCPEWSVRETLAHLAGVVDDGINGNMDGVATTAWTQTQVFKRANKTGREILEEWNTFAPFVEARATSLGLGMAQWLFDAVTHEHDLRFALGQPGARDSEALWVGAHFLATALPRRLAERQLPSVTLIISGETLHEGGDGDLSLRAPLFDFVRSCGSRRTVEQVRSLDWSAPPDGIIEHLMPFAPPTQVLPE